jgi:hypothetical protein
MFICHKAAELSSHDFYGKGILICNEIPPILQDMPVCLDARARPCLQGHACRQVLISANVSA